MVGIMLFTLLFYIYILCDVKKGFTTIGGKSTSTPDLLRHY